MQPKKIQWKLILRPTILAIGTIFLLSQIKTPQQTATLALSNCTVTSELTIDNEEQTLLQLINTYRQQNNLSQLKFSNNLTRGATWMSSDMATKNYLSHTDSSGRLPGQRLTDCGYNTFNTSSGENVAGGTTTANDTFTGWKNSPAHNANLLSNSFIVAGISRVFNPNSSLKWYWTLNLAGQDDTTTVPTNTPIPNTPTTTPAISTPLTSPTTTLSSNPTVTNAPTPTPPISTPTFNCMGAGPCLSDSPSNKTPTPTQLIESPSPTINNRNLLSLLLSIISLLLEFIRNLI